LERAQYEKNKKVLFIEFEQIVQKLWQFELEEIDQKTRTKIVGI